MRNFLVAIIAAVSLSACGLIPNTALNKFTKADADWALKDAKVRTPNSPLIPCFQQIDDNAAADLAAGPAPSGLLSGIQTGIDECQNLQTILNKCTALGMVAPEVYGLAVAALGRGCSALPQPGPSSPIPAAPVVVSPLVAPSS